MKNISKYWLLFMIAAMSATSCSDDDNEKVVMPDVLDGYRKGMGLWTNYYETRKQLFYVQ